MNTTASFKLSKYAKRMIALLPFTDQHQRGAFKQMMIGAQVAASIRPAIKRNRDVNNMPINDAT